MNDVLSKVSKVSKVIVLYCLILFIVSSVFTGCIPKEFTPSEKVQFTTMKGLHTAYDFRVFALSSAKVFWDKGLMSEETKDEIIDIGDKFQHAINETSLALEFYRKSSGVNGGDLGQKIQIYQELYVEFNNLVMPYIIQQLED